MSSRSLSRLQGATVRPGRDEAWLKALRLDAVSRQGARVVRHLRDVGAELGWIAVVADGGSASDVARLENAFTVSAGLDGRFARQPSELIRNADGMVLLFPEASGGPAPFSGPLAAWLSDAIAAAEALVSVHAQGVIHRNLTPEAFVRDRGTILLDAFEWAAPLDRATTPAAEPPADDDRLAYAAPEYARRSNPYADVRSDLYSFGVVLYETLAGRRPLDASSPAAWLHAHMAVSPEPIAALRPDAPPSLAALISRLLEKDPQRRPQSATDLLTALRRCQTDLGAVEARGEGRPLQNLSERFSLASAFVGRDAETDQLDQAFGRVKETGRGEIVLIGGVAGGGKSALLDRMSGLWRASAAVVVTGKCQQHQSDIPYGSVAQILRALVTRLLTSGADHAAAGRDAVVEALQGQGQLLADLVPEVELLIGRGASMTAVTATQAQARMNAAIVRTLGAFATPGAPLVVFFDDLQWADEGAWSLLVELARALPDNILLVGAYRPDEMDATSRLEAVEAAAKIGMRTVTQIRVAPLVAKEIETLVDAVFDRSSDSDLQILSSVLHSRTAGNPFHLAQMLRALIEDQVLKRSVDLGLWEWDATALSRHVGATDVVELVQGRITPLPAPTRKLIQTLGCVGNDCAIDLLARIMEVAPEQLLVDAGPALDAGLLVQDRNRLMFPHDRVLEAAYALTPVTQRPALHALIAVAMIDHHGPGETVASFEIAVQIERAGATRAAPARRSLFADALVDAARRATQTAAFDQALGFVDSAVSLLGEDHWTTDYHRSFAAARLRSECLLARMEIDQAAQAVALLMQRAQGATDVAFAWKLLALLRTLGSDYEGAIAAALAGLELLGVRLQRFPGLEDMGLANQAVLDALRGRSVHDLIDLPVSTDIEHELSMELLATLMAAVFVDSSLSFVHLAKMVELTLKRGATPLSPHGLAWYGVFSAHHFKNYDGGFQFAEVALKLTDRHAWAAGRGNVLVAADQVSAWTRPMSEALELAREAAAAGRAGGDLSMVCYAWNHIVSDLLFMGAPLDDCLRSADEGFAVANRIGYRDIARLIEAQRAYCRRLIDGTLRPAPPPSRNGDPFWEIGSPCVSQSTLFWDWLYAGMSAYLDGDFSSAADYLTATGRVAWAIPAHVNLVDYHLFAGLVAARSDAKAGLGAAREHLARLTSWAAVNPASFTSKQQLLAGELARSEGQPLAALAHFEAAINAAAEAGFNQDQALGHELSSVLLTALGLSSSARDHLKRARRCYERWGATHKSARLAAAHPFLAEDVGEPEAVSSDQTALDTSLALEVGRQLSEEIHLDQLIETLVARMMIHAGAQRGVFILCGGDQFVVRAVGRTVGDAVVVSPEARALSRDIAPYSIIRTVAKTKAALVLDDGIPVDLRDPSLSLDGRDARSVLCLPLVKQGELIGILYMDNDLTAGVFTPARIAMLELLAPQAAISLETARLYAELVAENARREKTELALRNARAELARSSHLTVMGSLAASIGHEINQPLSGIVSNAAASLRWLRRDTPDIDQALISLEGVEKGARRAADIVRSLRSLAKQAPTLFVPVRIDDVLDEVLSLTSAEIETRGIALDADLAGGPPVIADPVQLQQVILNLVTNAMDAMADQPAARRRLTVASGVEGEAVIVRIADTGSGIAPDDLDRIFEPFFTTKGHGLGMGLAICRSILEARGGGLVAESRPGEGTVFTVSIPVAFETPDVDGEAG